MDNLVELRSLAPDLDIVPVVQGWTVPSYLRWCFPVSPTGFEKSTRYSRRVTAGFLGDGQRSVGWWSVRWAGHDDASGEVGGIV